MKKYICGFITSLCFVNVNAQDTFSIVAVDTVTGEVGSAGASCVDLFAAGYSDASFLGELFPGVGAMNCQAAYLPGNQTRARARMNTSDTPEQVKAYMIANDVQNDPSTRQYGIVKLNGTSSLAATYTGSNCMVVANHVTGKNYSIQGNILLDSTIVANMEKGFNNTVGDLRCKLMGALQGANVVGADSRCASNGTSSLFAFIKVSKPTDVFGAPYFKLQVRTADNSEIEPIDSLQKLFDVEVTNCSGVGLDEHKLEWSISPNPVKTVLFITGLKAADVNYAIIDMTGKTIQSGKITTSHQVSLNGIVSGIYQLSIDGKGKQRFIIE